MKCKAFYVGLRRELENGEDRRESAFLRSKVEQEFLDQDGKTITIRKIMGTPNYDSYISYYYDEIKPHTKKNKSDNHHL